ncbi:MAG: 3'-5' exonuclease [Bacteroidota bacterium]
MNSHFKENITNEHIRNLPLLAFEGNIRVIENEEEVDKALDLLRKEKILGFDTEKKPTFKKGDYHPTAMIQLASHHEAFLFRLNKIGCPNSLFDLMSDPEKIKFGISIGDDLKELRKLNPFEPSGFFDLNHIVKDIGVKHIGVKKLAAIFLNKRISKGQQTSNWENDALTEAQQKYAATDAWICLKIHQKLREQGYL